MAESKWDKFTNGQKPKTYAPEFVVYLSNKDIAELKNFKAYDKDNHFITGEGINGNTFFINRDFIVKIEEV